MEKNTLFLVLAAIMLVLVILVPKMLSLRVKVLSFIGFNRLADWHERNCKLLIIIVRCLLVLFAVVLIFTAI